VHYYAIWNTFGAKELTSLQREDVADQLRYSDWFVTLPLLALDFGGLREAIAEKGGPDAPEPSKYVLALLMAVVVLLGAFWRVWAGELRGVASKQTPGIFKAFVGGLCFLGSCACFVPVVYFLLNGLDTSAVSGEPLEDALALQAFVVVWIGYPVVAALQALPGLGASGDEYGSTTSQLKAVVYALLDGFSKAGVAFYAAQKIHRTY
jgi:bacteriorhodopsin